MTVWGSSRSSRWASRGDRHLAERRRQLLLQAWIGKGRRAPSRRARPSAKTTCSHRPQVVPSSLSHRSDPKERATSPPTLTPGLDLSTKQAGNDAELASRRAPLERTSSKTSLPVWRRRPTAGPWPGLADPTRRGSRYDERARPSSCEPSSSAAAPVDAAPDSPGTQKHRP